MITIRAFGGTSVVDAEWTVRAVRAAVRKDCAFLEGPITVTLGSRAGVAAHVDANGDLLVVHVARVGQ